MTSYRKILAAALDRAAMSVEYDAVARDHYGDGAASPLWWTARCWCIGFIEGVRLRPLR